MNRADREFLHKLQKHLPDQGEHDCFGVYRLDWEAMETIWEAIEEWRKTKEGPDGAAIEKLEGPKP